jgi:hypothetical protein
MQDVIEIVLDIGRQPEIRHSKCRLWWYFIYYI